MLSCGVCWLWQEVGWRWGTGQGAPATQHDIGGEPGKTEDTNKLEESETKAIDDDEEEEDKEEEEVVLVTVVVVVVTVVVKLEKGV